MFVKLLSLVIKESYLFFSNYRLSIYFISLFHLLLNVFSLLNALVKAPNVFILLLLYANLLVARNKFPMTRANLPVD